LFWFIHDVYTLVEFAVRESVNNELIGIP